jgi:hypothetical protein
VNHPNVTRDASGAIVVTMSPCDYHVLLAASRRGCQSYREEHSARAVHAVEDLLLWLDRKHVED